MKPWEDDRQAANGRPVRENFLSWFEGSCAVDAQGQPMVLYHGTKSDVDHLRPSRGGEYGSGIYLTPDPGAAWMYAERSFGDAGENILAVYVSLRKPYVTQERDRVRALGVKKLQAQGYDGIVATSPTGERQYIVFDPCQVKSAIGNSGLFLTASAHLTDQQEHQQLALVRRAQSEALAVTEKASGGRHKTIR